MLNVWVYLFCVLTLVCGSLVITAKNPIHAILYLILTFCNVSFIFVLLNIEFIAIIFLIVYVGAIAVLFLFVVMMLNIKIVDSRISSWKYVVIGSFVVFCFLSQLFGFLFTWYLGDSVLLTDEVYYYYQVSSKFVILPDTMKYTLCGIVEKVPSIDDSDIRTSFVFILVSSITDGLNYLHLNAQLSNTDMLAVILYTHTFFVFFVVSLILLVAMLGSIILVLNQNVNLRRQLIFRQVLRNSQASVVLKN